MKQLFFSFLIFFLFVSCEKRTDWPLHTQNTNVIVVDGIITNQSQIHTVNINYPVSQLNEVPIPVTGAIVSIVMEDSTIILTEQPVNSGKYLTDSNFFGQTGKNYTLIINYENKVYTAKTYMVNGYSYLPNLEFVKNNENDLFYLKWDISQYNAQKASMWEILFDWSKVNGYTQQDPDSCKARLLFYTLPSLDVSEIFAPEVEKVYFPSGTIVNLRRFSLNPEHSEFIRSLLSETTWQGGIFSSTPANVNTNLSEGATGYFGACELVSIFQIVP